MAKHDASAGMLWVGDDGDGTRHRVQLIGRGADRRLLVQRSLPGEGWRECSARALPPAGQALLRILGDLCAHALAEEINPACELKTVADVGEHEIAQPTFDVGEIYLVGAR